MPALLLVHTQMFLSSSKTQWPASSISRGHHCNGSRLGDSRQAREAGLKEMGELRLGHFSACHRKIAMANPAETGYVACDRKIVGRIEDTELRNLPFEKSLV